jgi:hypothetical protein
LTRVGTVLESERWHRKLTLTEERKWERLIKIVAVMARSFMIAAIASVDGIGKKIRRKRILRLPNEINHAIPRKL